VSHQIFSVISGEKQALPDGDFHPTLKWVSQLDKNGPFGGIGLLTIDHCIRLDIFCEGG